MSFNQLAFDKWDLAGKTAISGHLTSLGYTVNQSGRYDIDFSVSGSGRHFDLDVEIKGLFKWTDKPFPFDTVDFAYRKNRYEGTNSYLVVLNTSLTRGVVFPVEAVASSPIVLKNVGRQENEEFHRVALNLGKEFRINTSYTE